MNFNDLAAIQRKLPLSAACLKRNQVVEDNPARPSAAQPQSIEGHPLVSAPPGEDSRWYGTASRFHIRFFVYAMRPCDWDGWHIKELQDMLIHAGLLPDDAWNIVEGSIVSYKAKSKKEQRTEIVIAAL